MQFRKVSIPDVERAIRIANGQFGYELSFDYTSGMDGNFRGRIVPDSSYVNGARRGRLGARASTLHGCADQTRNDALFCEHPDAIVRTSMAYYNGLQGFQDTYPATGDHNIGSQMQPITMPELCDHESNVPPTAAERRFAFTTSTHPQTQAINDEFGWDDSQTVVFVDE